MAQPFAEHFYNSRAWKKCRASFIADRIAIDGGLCQSCHKANGYIVHHTIILTPENIGNPDITLNHELLRYECKACHDEHEGHGLHPNSKPGLRFDEYGDPIPPSKSPRG